MASLACEVFGYHDFGMLTQLDTVRLALHAFEDSNDILFVRLESQKSEAGPGVECLGITAHFSDNCRAAHFPRTRAKAIRVDLWRSTLTCRNPPASCGSRSPVTSRFGQAELKLLLDISSGAGGTLTEKVRDILKRRSSGLPKLAPREINYHRDSPTEYTPMPG